MSSQKAVQDSLNHIKPDYLPLDFGSTPVTGMHVSCVADLRKHFGLEDKPVKVIEPYQMLGEIDTELAEIIGIDVAAVSPVNNLFGFKNEDWKEWTMPHGLTVLVPGKFETSMHEDGGVLIYPEGDRNARPSGKMPATGFFFDTIVRQDPIDDSKLDPKDNLEEFKHITDEELDHFNKECKAARATGKSVLANFGFTGFGDIALVPAPFLKDPKGIRDVQEWYLSILMRPDYIHAIFEEQCNIAIANLEKINARCGDDVDIAYICGTDFGTQDSTFCSEETYRELYMPYYVRVNSWIHENTNWKTFKHTCGAVIPLIPALIESGFDILNPVQCSAAGMDPNVLKDTYNKNLTFWGGGVDTQKTLPFGTPEEVYAEVTERCEIFSKDGGFVFNAIHNVQAKTPVENILAMINAVKNFNGQEQI